MPYEAVRHHLLQRRPLTGLACSEHCARLIDDRTRQAATMRRRLAYAACTLSALVGAVVALLLQSLWGG